MRRWGYQDLSILGSDAAGTLVTYSGMGTIISAVSSSIGRTRVSINKNFFHDQSIRVLIAKMQPAKQAKLDLIHKSRVK